MSEENETSVRAEKWVLVDTLANSLAIKCTFELQTALCNGDAFYAIRCLNRLCDEFEIAYRPESETKTPDDEDGLK